ncbi:MAG: cytochrome C oxidase subunit IV family protein [Flavobacteriales bacterium]|nr:cytochrome C oxidase subunit IV family protein [Flavobacteriales bacterium]
MHYKNSEEYEPISYVPHVESHGTSEIWRTLTILTVLTVVDIILYFTMPLTGFRNFIFIVLGIVKAYYIVASFMHMKHEKIDLAACILVPLLFVLGLIAGLLYEGNFWLLNP